jgi:phospholipase C
MLVVSPWSRGGWVCSETFDHTSVIRFIEKRFGLHHDLREANITPWRRAVCGDLTSAFDFATPNAALPALPSTTSYAPPDRTRHPDYVPVPPAVGSVPKQEPGVRNARALPYELFVRFDVNGNSGHANAHFVNTGRAGAVFLVYTAGSLDAPRTYTVEAGKRLEDQLTLAASGAYDFSVHGPNGFLRRYAGKQVKPGWFGGNETARPEVAEGYDVANGNLQLRLHNTGSARCQFTLVNAYDAGATIQRTVRGGDTEHLYLDLRNAHGWYDLTITVDSDSTYVRRIAGHVETGRPSYSDPALGA